MKQKIYCLLTSSVSLNKRAADILFDTACLMIRDNSSIKRFKDGGTEGRLKTSFNQNVLGGVVGTEFHADIETELGNGKVKFLVRPVDAELRNKLEWVPIFTIDDLVEDIAPTPGRAMPIQN